MKKYMTIVISHLHTTGVPVDGDEEQVLVEGERLVPAQDPGDLGAWNKTGYAYTNKGESSTQMYITIWVQNCIQ